VGWVKTSSLEGFTVKRNILECVDKQRFELFGLKPLNIFVPKPLALLKILAIAIYIPMLEFVVRYEQIRSQILIQNDSASHATMQLCTIAVDLYGSNKWINFQIWT